MRHLVLASCVFAVGCAGGTRAPTAPTMEAAAQTQAQVAPTETQSVAAAPAAQSSTEVPFRGTLQAVETHTGSPPVLHSVLTGTGQATHFGRFTATFEFDIQLGLPSTTTGIFTVTAANGDSISGTLTGSGTASSGIVTIEETATITAGTGRFADVTGSFRIDRVANQNTLTSSGSLDGTINLGH
jgi:hypothetical protein